MSSNGSTAGQEVLFASFLLGQTEYAVRAFDIREIVNGPEQLQPIEQCPAYLLGSFELREMVIPVLDLNLYYGQEASSRKLIEDRIAIFAQDGKFLGLRFDATKDIFKLKPGQDLKQKLIEVQSFFDLNEIPFKVLQSSKAASDFVQKNRGEKRQIISFEVDSKTLSFEMDRVQEIIHLDQLSESALIADACIGMTDLRGQVLPILDLGALLGFRPPVTSEIATAPLSKVLVLNLGSNRHVGLLVDRIHSLLNYFTGEVEAFDENLFTDPKLCLGGVTIEDPVQLGQSLKGPEKRFVYILSIESFLEMSLLHELSQGHQHLYRSHLKVTDQNKKNSRASAFISFKLNRLYALPIMAIREILDMPELDQIKPSDQAFLCGTMSLRGEEILLFDNKKLYNLEIELRPHLQKILILENGTQKYGLIVEEVEAIRNFKQEDRFPMPSLLLNPDTPQLNFDILDSAEVELASGKIDRILILKLENLWRRLRFKKSA